MTYILHEGDLPGDLEFGPVLAVDTETMGLVPGRDRLCLVQLFDGSGPAHMVRLAASQSAAPNLGRQLDDPARLKLFHFARFDVAVIERALGVTCSPLFCTKVASKLARTYTDRHGLRDLCRELLAVDISKQEQSSDWGAAELSDSQLRYAASDVLHLHALKARLETMLVREGRMDLAQACMSFLPTRAKLDLAGWPEIDVFAH